MHNKRRKIIKLFESRKGNLEHRLKKDYIRNGIATIPYRVLDYHDIIRTCSVKGYETPNPEFVDCIKEAADVTPTECPLVLNLVGDCLSHEEKKTIKDTIQDYFGYNLGMVEKEEKRHKNVFILMFFGLLISGVLLWLTQTMEEESRELFFVLFWFMGDTLCDYIFLTGHDLRHDRRLAGRLASVKVVFSDTFEKQDYTESDVKELYSEIEKDVKETIQVDEHTNN